MNRIYLFICKLNSCFFLFISWILSRKETKDLWLISERGVDARDNGYWFFLYLKRLHPEINSKYIISHNSPDFSRLSEWSDSIVEYNSFEHYINIWKAKYCCSTHKYGCYPYYVSRIRLMRHFLLSQKKIQKNIWLQHGIIKDDIKSVHYENMPVDLMICGAAPELPFVINTLNYPPTVAKYTGLARFDGLHNINVNKKQILLMPTWRRWLNKENFLSSDYLRGYTKLLSDNLLHEFLESNGLSLVFYPHHDVQPYISVFKQLRLPSSIIIADKNHYDVQQLLKESALLITDYSSVFFDFSYMKKPVIYYQFDEDEFRKNHYAKGYYDYHNGLGEWCDTIASLLLLLNKSYRSGFAITDKMQELIDYYFPIRDRQNCSRIYSYIMEL